MQDLFNLLYLYPQIAILWLMYMSYSTFTLLLDETERLATRMIGAISFPFFMVTYWTFTYPIFR